MKSGKRGDRKIWLSWRFIRSCKKNTAALFFGFVLTFLLLTVLLTMLHTNFHIANIQAKAEFTPSDCYIDGLSAFQRDLLADDPEVVWMGVQQGEGRLYQKNNQQVYVTKNDEAASTMMSQVLEGRLPGKPGEVAAEKWTLLNLGIEPTIGQKVILTDPDTGKTREFRLTGILSDIYGFKKYGLLNLFAACTEDSGETFMTYLIFSEKTVYEEKVSRLQEELGISGEQIRECPAREDRSSLYLLDAELTVLVLVICMVVFYGIYRITLMSRASQYGILRALGMKKRALRRMMLRELYLIYLAALPVGILLGLLTAWGLLLLSQDRESGVCLFGQTVEFHLVIPAGPILLCGAAAAVCVGITGYAAGRRVVKPSVIRTITGSADKKGCAGKCVRLARADSKTGMLLRMGGKYLLRDVRTSGFVALTICVGVVLFTGLAYKARTLGLYREDTRELYYLNGQYAMTMQYFDTVQQGISRESMEKIRSTEEILSVKTASFLPVRVVDDEDVPRIDSYYDRHNQARQELYGYSDAGFDGKDQIYKSLFCGYNENALKALEPYVVEGSFDWEHLEEDEIILSVLRMKGTGEDQIPGSYKEGTPLMEYHAGDRIRMKYRADLETDSQEYENLSDQEAPYIYRTYRVAAIVSFPYMYDCRRTLYPMLITSDRYMREIAPDSAIQCMYLDGEEGLSGEQQTELERELIRAGSRSENISTRSLIREIRQNEMFYFKQMVYIVGIAVTAFVLVLVNMINNLRYRMQSRTREICMLRAVGLSIPMVKRMLLFENLILGAVGILSGFLVLWPVLRYVYFSSEMNSFGHGFAFDWNSFGMVSAGALLVCAGLSVRILKSWKSRSIMDGIGKFE